MTPEEITTLRDRIERRRGDPTNWGLAVDVETLSEMLDAVETLDAIKDAALRSGRRAGR